MSAVTAIPAKPGARVRVEFMPGRVAELPAFEVGGVPKYVMCRLAKQANGHFALVPETWHQMVRLTSTLHREMGLPCSYRTIYNLVKAGFVRGSLISTRTILVDLASLIEHFKRTELGEDKPAFWTRDRIDRYRYAALSSAVNECDESDDEAE